MVSLLILPFSLVWVVLRVSNCFSNLCLVAFLTSGKNSLGFLTVIWILLDSSYPVIVVPLTLKPVPGLLALSGSTFLA